MYISINWIKDFVNLDGIEIDNLISRFISSTAEIEQVIRHGENIEGIITAKILKIEEHPKTDKLKIVKLDIGGKTIQSVCGAANIQEDQIVPFAPVNSIINSGEVIKETEIEGKHSSGMCLSEKELGISDNHSGVIILPDNTDIGIDIKKILDIEDIVFEIDNKSLTNRPDLWGHYGIAREIAAIMERPLKKLEVEDLSEYNFLPELNINVKNEDKCYRFTAIAIENITQKNFDINKRIRLFYCGYRSISLLVDLTNYMMMELGQPMHAYDKRLISNINVKALDNDIEFVTLDSVKRNVPKGTLMICNEDSPISIAGIMGGENTEVKENTNSLFLESANFDAYSIRKSTLDLKLRTDASSHYEKALDTELTELSIKRYVKLLKENDTKIRITSKLTDIYKKKYEQIKINISKEYINGKIGTELNENEIYNILSSLGFNITNKNSNFEVIVPTHRATKDINIKADLVEEIARIYGYDNIKPKTTIQPLQTTETDYTKITENQIKDLLSLKYGMSEIHSYIWYDKNKNNQLGIEVGDNIKIVNSLNANCSMLRASIIPSLLYSLSENLKYGAEINIFELGRVFNYTIKSKECIEKKSLGIVICSKKLTEKELLKKGISVINSISSLTKNVSPSINEMGKVEYKWISSINSGRIEIDNQEIGYVSELELKIKDLIDKKIECVVIEIDVDMLNRIHKNNNMYKEVSKYQTTDIDLTIITDKTDRYSDIKNIIEEIKTEYITNYEVIDIYENNAKMKDKKSITIRFTLSSKEHTLLGTQISDVITSMINNFQSRGYTIKTI